MSLDLWLESPKCPTCGHVESTDELNYTYNVAPMWRKIFPDAKCMVDIDGMTGKDSLHKLMDARIAMEFKPEVFKALNPENNWGSYDGFLKYLKQLSAMAANYSNYIWRASR